MRDSTSSWGGFRRKDVAEDVPVVKGRRSASDNRRRGRKPQLARTGKVLRAARQRSNLALRSVSERLNVSSAQLSDMERGISPTSLQRVRLISEVLGIPRVTLVNAILQDRLDEAGLDDIVVRARVQAPKVPKD